MTRTSLFLATYASVGLIQPLLAIFLPQERLLILPVFIPIKTHRLNTLVAKS